MQQIDSPQKKWMQNKRLRILDQCIAGVLDGDEKDEDRMAMSLQEMMVDEGLNQQPLSECRRLLANAQKGTVQPIYGWKPEEEKTAANRSRPGPTLDVWS